MPESAWKYRHLGTNRMQTVYDAVSKLNKAGIINKNGGKISLKEL